MFTCDIIAVSNRHLCSDFFGQLSKINEAGIPIIFREKDLTENEYESLAKRALELCPDIILHTFTDAARRMGCKRIHLPMALLEKADLTGFDVIGASTHLPEEAVRAQKLGASYVTAGHIFATDCKRGVPPRGLEFLKEVCEAVTIPVYAIGGLTPDNAQSAMEAGAAGVCVMSGLMNCSDVGEYVKALRKKNLRDRI